jgi:LPXTG-motif cell wall-anchored protein
LSRIKHILSPQQTGWQSTSQRRRKFAGQIALAAIIVLAVLIPLAQSQGVLQGAATGETGTAIIIFLLLAVGSLTAWFLWRRKK